jgi:hypothetical protein
MQSGRAGIHRDRVGRAYIGAEFLLELRRPRTGGEPPGSQRGFDFSHFLVADGGNVKRDEWMGTHVYSI